MDKQPQGKRKVKKPVQADAQTAAQGMAPGEGAEAVEAVKAQMPKAQPDDGWEPIQQPAQPTAMPPAQKPQRSMQPAGFDAPSRFGQDVSAYTDTPIGPEEIKGATETLARYEAGRGMLKSRIVDNESWYRLRHWQQIVKPAGGKPNNSDPEPTSAWLFNSLANKHADAMDNYPEPTVLPREAGDKPDAEMLTSILPTVLDQNGFERTYSDVWWYKLKNGFSVVGIFWDNAKYGGLGDIAIRKIDALNLLWQPGISDIQESRNVFHVELADRDTLIQQYPDKAQAIRSFVMDIKPYRQDDPVDNSDKVLVVDWYYKKAAPGKTLLHYCKFTCGEILYASENDPEYRERGFYDHGKFPFVIDVLFPEESTPVGFGYVDVCKSPQLYIDKLDSLYIKHAALAARQRFFARRDININMDEFRDGTRDIITYEGSGNPADVLYPINLPALDGSLLSLKQQKIDELKETSGNRDFSQGGTASGVTAASAIAALQEAGNKLSRDQINSSYLAFQDICYFCIDLMRQFYNEPRFFRIIGKQGEMKFVEFNGQNIAEQDIGTPMTPDAKRVPYFDIRVIAQKSSPFSTVAQNERAKELYGMGFFSPDRSDQALACLSMMQFEGIEQVRETIQKNGTLFEAIQQLGPITLTMAQQLDALSAGKTNYTQEIASIVQGYIASAGQPNNSGGAETQTNVLGDALSTAKNTQVGNARKQAAAQSTPRVKRSAT
ncbi:MAG TPA: hypothetical protein PLP25_02935 [Candidatus Limiplasma sp.]|mgnify:CR=1 FL=1|nr:hypothetical protein [Candidatus Limiplasma sp.]HPS80803.1 hypothetical protein [Candidatus Limiplasma sp.]